MLKKLSIQNYVIIPEIEINFSDKLNVITGETGAGKSILMGALSLILGDRADTTVLLNRDKKCCIEGTFSAGNKKEVKIFLKENDLDAEDELVIRREISANGKSRAFVNDTPVNLEQLRALSSRLVDLHRQFDTQELGEADFQREVLDALAGHQDVLFQYQRIYKQWQQGLKDLEKLQEQKKQFTREFDYNKFLFDELEEAGFVLNELEEADAMLKLLSNAEGIKGALTKVVYELSEGDQPFVQQLKSLSSQLLPYSSFHAEIPALILRLQSVHIELKDINSELEHINDQIQFDPKRIEQLNERIAIGYKLQKKHGVQTTAELLSIKNNLEEKLQAVLNIDEAIVSKEKEVENQFENAHTLSITLSNNRNKQIKPLQDKVSKLLIQVGMPNARLQVRLENAPLNFYGGNDFEFLFDANLPAVQAGLPVSKADKNSRYEPISKVASGGERSRLMLCIKSLVAQSLDLPTLIFDEIDSGISGEAARQVGIIMKELAANRQVITITHQPQIAGKADTHFFVYKEIKQDVIKTNIRILSNEERITTIAQMLSGEKPTAAALENAREMVRN
ncbi:MAG: DNA repair protein RecN [Chitinophagaceae bacterium]